MFAKYYKKYFFFWGMAGLFLGGIAFYTFVVIGWDGLTTAKSRKIWRQQITNLYNDLKIGMEKEKVEEVINVHKWPPENLYCESSFLVLNSPLEMGARNWVLRIEFDKKEKVIGIKIRTSDGPDYKPSEAPGDKPGRNSPN